MTPTTTMPLSVEESQIHVAVAGNYSGGYNANESNGVTELSCTIGNGNRENRFAAKGFFYGGIYRMDGTYRNLSGSQPYFGLGIVGDINFGQSHGPLSHGFGATVGVLSEFGPYIELYTAPNLTKVWPIGSMYYFSTVNLSERSQFGLLLGGGFPGVLYLSSNLFYDRWGGTVGIGADISEENDEYELIGRLSLGLSYRVL